MKRVWLGILLVGLVGCGTQPLGGAGQQAAEQPPPDTRLEVTPKLRAACAASNFSDLDIDTLISEAEADRLAGFSYSTEIQHVVRVCAGVAATNPQLGRACITCSVAIVDQVYGF